MQASELLRARVTEMEATGLWVPPKDTSEAAADEAEPIDKQAVDVSYADKDASDVDHDAFADREVGTDSTAVHHELEGGQQVKGEVGPSQKRRRQRFAKVRSAGGGDVEDTLEVRSSGGDEPWVEEFVAKQVLEVFSALAAPGRQAPKPRKRRVPDLDEGQQGWEEELEPNANEGAEAYAEPRGLESSSNRSASQGIVAGRSGRSSTPDLRDTGSGRLQNEGASPRHARRHRSAVTPRSPRQSINLEPRSPRPVHHSREVEADAGLEVEETYIL